jgi:hypothetical protein
VRLEDLGKKDAVPMSEQEYERIRANSMAERREAKAHA